MSVMPSASRALAGHRKYYSCCTEQDYVGKIKRYMCFHDVRHPSEMGGPEATALLIHLLPEVARGARSHAALRLPYRVL